MNRIEWEITLVEQELAKTYSDKETIVNYAKYIVEHELPRISWLDVDECSICGGINHEFHSTETMIQGGVGVICEQCLIDL
jgi:hypothetical protein